LLVLLREPFFFADIATLMKPLFSPNQVLCLQVTGQLFLSKRWSIAKILFCHFGSVLLEGGTLGAIIVALNSLVTGQPMLLPFFPQSLNHLLESLELISYFLWMIGFAVAFQLLRSVLSILTVILSSDLKSYITYALYEKLLSRIMRTDYQKISLYKSGVLNELLAHSERLTLILTSVVLNHGLQAALMLSGYAAFMIALSPKLTLFSITLLAIIYTPTYLLTKRLMRLGQQYTEESLALGSSSMQYLSSARLLRTFGKTEYALHTMLGIMSKKLRRTRASDILIGYLDPLVTAVFIVGIGVILFWSIQFFNDDLFKLAPIIITFLIIVNRMQGNYSHLAKAVMTLTNFLGVIDAIGGFFSATQERLLRRPLKQIDSIQTDIVFNSVSFRHAGAKTYLFDNLDLTIERRVTTAIVGPSGSGKSTLVDLILGLLPTSSGAICVNNLPISDLGHDEWLNHFGVVEQDVVLFNDTIKNNIAFGKQDASMSDIIKAAKLGHAAEFIDRLPQQYGTFIGDRGSFLSGGQKQRIGIARALVREPEVLVLDEATSSLDSESEVQFQSALDELKKTRTIILIAHRLSTVMHADRVIALRHGKVIEDGRPRDLLDNHGYFYDMWNTQRKSI